MLINIRHNFVILCYIVLVQCYKITCYIISYYGISHIRIWYISDYIIIRYMKLHFIMSVHLPPRSAGGRAGALIGRHYRELGPLPELSYCRRQRKWQTRDHRWSHTIVVEILDVVMWSSRQWGSRRNDPHVNSGFVGYSLSALAASLG